MTFYAVDRREVDPVLFGIASGMTGCEKNKMLAVGQEPRPTLSGMLGFIEYRCRGCRATLRAHFLERSLEIRSEHDHIVAAPASSPRIGGIGQAHNRAARGGNLHQFSAGKEADVTAIRRPERMRSTGSAVELLRRAAVERADPQQLGFAGMRDEGDLVALWGKHRHAAGIAGGVQGKLVGRRDFGMDRERIVRRILPIGTHRILQVRRGKQKRCQDDDP